jgi:mycofactocin precursor peptide peptidase
MTWSGLAEAVGFGGTTVILPLGATEQHGPHLPLGTDTVRAEALADRLAERLGPGTLVAPTLPFGCSDEHRGFPGLMGVEAETLARVILDLARRFADWDVRRLVLLSAHGGNGRALDLALDALRQELPGLEVLTDGGLEAMAPALLETARREGLSASELGLHAGESETSEMLHLRPELVSESRDAGFTGDMEVVMDDLRASGLAAVTHTGVLGDPDRADAGRGARYLDAVADELAAKLRRETRAS